MRAQFLGILLLVLVGCSYEYEDEDQGWEEQKQQTKLACVTAMEKEENYSAPYSDSYCGCMLIYFDDYYKKSGELPSPQIQQSSGSADKCFEKAAALKNGVTYTEDGTRVSVKVKVNAKKGATVRVGAKDDN